MGQEAFYSFDEAFNELQIEREGEIIIQRGQIKFKNSDIEVLKSRQSYTENLQEPVEIIKLENLLEDLEDIEEISPSKNNDNDKESKDLSKDSAEYEEIAELELKNIKNIKNLIHLEDISKEPIIYNKMAKKKSKNFKNWVKELGHLLFGKIKELGHVLLGKKIDDLNSLDILQKSEHYLVESGDAPSEEIVEIAAEESRIQKNNDINNNQIQRELTEKKIDNSRSAPKISPMSSIKEILRYSSNFVLKDRYQIIGFLGEGRFAHAWLAKDTITPCTELVVIKFLKDEFLHDSTKYTLILDEAKYLTKLEDERGVPKFYSSGITEINGKMLPFLITNFIQGGTIDTLSPEDLKLKLKIAIEVCRILSVSHLKKILHNDIKFRHIIFFKDSFNAQQEQVSIIDWNVAKYYHEIQPYKTFSADELKRRLVAREIDNIGIILSKIFPNARKVLTKAEEQAKKELEKIEEKIIFDGQKEEDIKIGDSKFPSSNSDEMQQKLILSKIKNVIRHCWRSSTSQYQTPYAIWHDLVNSTLESGFLKEKEIGLYYEKNYYLSFFVISFIVTLLFSCFISYHNICPYLHSIGFYILLFCSFLFVFTKDKIFSIASYLLPFSIGLTFLEANNFFISFFLHNKEIKYIIIFILALLLIFLVFIVSKSEFCYRKYSIYDYIIFLIPFGIIFTIFFNIIQFLDTYFFFYTIGYLFLTTSAVSLAFRNYMYSNCLKRYCLLFFHGLGVLIVSFHCFRFSSQFLIGLFFSSVIFTVAISIIINSRNDFISLVLNHGRELKEEKIHQWMEKCFFRFYT